MTMTTTTTTTTQCEDEFWRENKNMVGDGGGWTWTLAVILLIFTFRLLASRFRFLSRRRPSPSDSISGKSKTDDPPPSLRTRGIISDWDLRNLMNDLNSNSPDGTVIWENVIEKSTNSISYMAKCCKPKDGPLKYMSVTTFEDCSIEVLLNFYMDNSYRMQWDKTVVHHRQLQVDRDSATEFGRTVKKFPFLTPREYVLAWKIWQGKDGSFYCFSKECDHPLAPKEKRYVRVAVFRSGWRIRKVPGRNACEIRMVHQEDAGLNVEMAKMAFSKGIWSYVRKMDDALRRYSAGGQQHLLLNSPVGSNISIQKVPPEFEVADDNIITKKSGATHGNDRHTGTCKSNELRRKLTKWPPNKLIANGLVLLGGAICLSRGHSSLGTKVAMAYLLSKLTTHSSASSKKAGNNSCNKV